MAAFGRTFHVTQPFNVFAPGRAPTKLLASSTSFRRPVISRNCAVLKAITSRPGPLHGLVKPYRGTPLEATSRQVPRYTDKMNTATAAQRDEESSQHAPDSKLTLAGHVLEGISIAGQVSWKLHQLVAAHFNCAQGMCCQWRVICDVHYVHAYIVGNLHHPALTKCRL